MSEAEVREAFAIQAKATRQLDSPFMARLMTLFHDRLVRGSAVANRVLDWPGDPLPSAESVPLRLAGALHALKLEGRALTQVYPPQDASDEALWTAVTAALGTHSDRILDWLERAPQTNEVRRAAAILPVLAELNAQYEIPVHLMELGCSGGLNLRMDRFALEAGGVRLGDPASAVKLEPDWTGLEPHGQVPTVEGRAGVDLAPPDPLTDEGRLRLLAYLWPDQPDRIARTEAAIELARALPADIDRADAGAWLDATLPRRPSGALTVISHTIAWQYFPRATAARAETAIARAAKTATRNAPLARIAMEADGKEAAAVTLTTWPGGRATRVARADFHGRWIDWKGLPDAL